MKNFLKKYIYIKDGSYKAIINTYNFQNKVNNDIIIFEIK